MKILFVHPSTTMSIGDVGRGYRGALERGGHEVIDYYLDRRIAYHQRAVPPHVASDQPQVISKMASETILNEAMYNSVDLVLIISGLNAHPIALWLLGQVGIPAAVIFTESPYDDVAQAQWASLTHVNGKVDLTIFTNDRWSAMNHGWCLLPPSFDPAIHRPVASEPDMVCDAVIVGTGWPERQAFLEAVDWSDIDLRIYGIWPALNADSPLHRFYRPGVVDNYNIASMYCSAKVCINFHRKSEKALTPGPRTFELAGCGAFQLSDHRRDLATMFGDSVPTFDSPQVLGDRIRYYLANPAERATLAAKSRNLVQYETFDQRAASMVAALQSQSLQPTGTEGAN